MIGELINHYRVQELVGRGAMGIVYKALDLNLDRQVAIKVMSAEARNDPDFVERFHQEARMQGALNHPNVALLFDYFVHDGAPVAVMEYIDGESLDQLIRRRGPIPARESIPIFRQALRGVAAAHRAGIIHRDLKAANLMITRDDIVKVMDFGIAKRQSATGATKASTSIGSPLYMAPEQILGRAVDYRTDVYALGITLYQLLSGQPPFNPRGKTEYSVLNAHVNDLPEPPTVHCRDIPEPIVDAVMRALAKEPDARFQSADEFMRALPDLPPLNAATPRQDPIATVAPRVGPTGTVAIEYSPPMSTDPLATDEPGITMVFEQAAATVPDLMQRLRAHRVGTVAVLIAALVLGTLVRHPARLNATPRAPASTEAAAPSADLSATTAVAARPDLAGIWRGAYVDASGKQLLRVLSLSIRRVHEDGGIDGTLQYAAASGDGECKLHPRGSAYSAGEERLQLSPEGCSPHYPKELGVPLDFDGVNPQADVLQNGRIEAPTGEVIRVSLKRVSGV